LLLLSSDGRRALPTTIVNGQEMVSLETLASTFGLTFREDTLAGAVTVGYRGSTIVLTPDQSLASVAGRLVSLPAPLTRVGRDLIVPVEFINRALGLVYESPLDLRKASRLLIAGNLRVPRVTARYEPAQNATRVIFDIAPPTPVAVAQDRDRLVVRFEADWLDAALGEVPDQPFLDSARVVDPGTVIALDPGSRFGVFRATTTSGDGASSRLTIDLLPSDLETAAPSSPAPAPPFSAPGEPAPFTPTTTPSVRTIVLDPGHGGEENGARGPGGVAEKTVTFAVANRLKTLIETRLGMRVLLTRTGDRTVTLDERAAIANNHKADVFISLHANASARRALKGAEVFYLSLDNYGDQARRIAAAERQTLPVFGGGERDIEIVQWDMAQARHVDESMRLAGMIEAELRGKVEMGPRAMQQAPFRVLSGANMPAVLVEMGFISNAEQERQLTSDAFQTAVAQALFDAVVRFRDSLAARTPVAALTPAPLDPPTEKGGAR
jgi:N-acetylmuramoyl-L-alanine amidase